jgi:hypothetical protein
MSQGTSLLVPLRQHFLILSGLQPAAVSPIEVGSKKSGHRFGTTEVVP